MTKQRSDIFSFIPSRFVIGKVKNIYKMDNKRPKGTVTADACKYRCEMDEKTNQLMIV